MVRIRFSRVGRPHAHHYRLVASDRRSALNAKPIENLGTFNPRNMKNPEAINIERIRYWVSKGAQPTDSVVHTLKIAGLWDQVKPATASKPATATKAGKSA